MQRYKDTQLVKNEDGKRNYETTYWPNYPVTDEDIFVISKRGDRLDIYAYEFYRDSTLWVILATANNLANGTLVIEPNTRIRIPSPENIIDYQRRVKEFQY